MSVTAFLFRLARLSADARAVSRAVETGSLAPVAKRMIRKQIGRAWGRSGIPSWPR